MIKKYTADYSYANPNFVIQNLEEKKGSNDLLPLIYVLKNILQRGFPVVFSKYLQEKIGQMPSYNISKDRFLVASHETQHWIDTIKGDDVKHYYPAKDFYETIIPQEFGEYSFVQSMMIPEIPINEITGEDDDRFVNQQVDFYLPQALLVIEIDGQQHKLLDTQRVSDRIRNSHLLKYGIQTIRITTDELGNGQYKNKVQLILNRIKQYGPRFTHYKNITNKVETGTYSEEEFRFKILPSAIMRFQILLLELLEKDYLQIGEKWKFNIRLQEIQILKDDTFARLAIEDLSLWLGNLYQLKTKTSLPPIQYEVKIAGPRDFSYEPSVINIDFSIFKRYTDENKTAPEIIYVRSDYFDFLDGRQTTGLDKNYFRVSTTDSINYQITDDDKPLLRFFLQNIFGKNDFRDGQYAIISNALNLRDTIGLLPTGGGKSLCYQLPCLLQPAINFIVCPIKSLMYDQAENLRKPEVSITNTNFISSDLNAAEKNKVLKDYSRGRYLFIWISPERFQIPSFRESMATIVSDFNVAYAVVDEVHCLSEWGHDFRTSYLNLAKTIDRLSPKDDYGEGVIKYIGLTATASVNVLKDIKIEFSRRKQQLEEDNIKSLLDYSRKELEFYVVDDGGSKQGHLLTLFNNENIPEEREKATLVFTPTVNPTVNGDTGCYNLYVDLNRRYPGQVAWYSGSSPKVMGMVLYDDVVLNRIKQETQKGFKSNKYQILCATKAFGMGIDKDDIFFTFHYGIPSSVEALYQEAGRAGRWDKSREENKDKVAHCYVLFSPESPALAPVVEGIFTPGTSVDSIKNLFNANQANGHDIFTQLYLLLGNLYNTQTEYDLLMAIINTYYQENSVINISVNSLAATLVVPNVRVDDDIFEKGIYRLCLMGIVEDWSRDFQNNFWVKFGNDKDEHVLKSLSSYINKYEVEENVLRGITSINNNQCSTFVEKAAWYLLEWIFTHIVESRLQSLKTLYDWCVEFTTSAEFKQRLDSYFTFTESTFVLQHIADHPQDIEKWFEPFYSNKQIITTTEFQRLRDRLSRFLEGYHHSAGLDFVSGYTRLYINNYDDTDGRIRFESALSAIKGELFNDDQRHLFIDLLLKLLKDSELTEQQLDDVCTSILKFFPDLAERLSKELNMPQLMNEAIKANIQKLKELNIKLYEQFGGIQ